MNEADARPYSHPAPYGGWNARGNLANMPFTDAIQMDNIFPGVQEVELRKGRIDWKTGFGANIRTLMPYHAATTSKLFAATSSGVYDATGSGVVGAVVSAATNGFWSHTNIANSGGSWLIMVNGVDDGKRYDGTTWFTSGITGVAGSSLNYVTLHQKRLWFVEKSSMNLWYLGTESVTGAATKFPVGALFKKGGYVLAIGSWTIDSGSGTNDLFVIVTSNGEAAAYQGTDPSSSTTWALLGVYEVPRPLGNRPLIDFGGDLLYLSRNGLIPLSKLAQSAVLDRSQQVSYKIDGAMAAAADTSSSVFGWQMVLHKTKNMLVVNAPVSADVLSYQFVMNTITGAWCRFTNWNASCWAVLDDDIYFAGGTTVSKAWTGFNDAGTPIIGQVAQAYSYLGSRGQKAITLARMNFSLGGSLTLQMTLDTDFRTFSGETTIGYTATSTGALWDAGLWDTGLWDGGDQTIDPKWETLPGELGYQHSFRMQVTTSQSAFSWTSTDFAWRPAGIL